MSILTPKAKTKTATISVRIPSALAAELDALKVAADAAGYSVDLTEAVQFSIAKAIKEAQALISKSVASQSASQQQNSIEPPAQSRAVEEVAIADL